MPVTHATHAPFEVTVASVSPKDAGHELTVTSAHVSVEAVSLKVDPHVHATHRELAVVEPAEKPSPALQLAFVCAAQALVLGWAVKVPGAHVVHCEFADAVPAVKPFPAGHPR